MKRMIIENKRKICDMCPSANSHWRTTGGWAAKWPGAKPLMDYDKTNVSHSRPKMKLSSVISNHL